MYSLYNGAAAAAMEQGRGDEEGETMTGQSFIWDLLWVAWWINRNEISKSQVVVSSPRKR